MDHHNQPPPRGGRTVTAKDVAQANDYFEHFLNATSLKNILGYYRSICEHLNLKPNHFPLFYPKLKSYLTSWRAKALWKKFDARAVHKCYGKGKLCTSSRYVEDDCWSHRSNAVLQGFDHRGGTVRTADGYRGAASWS